MTETRDDRTVRQRSVDCTMLAFPALPALVCVGHSAQGGERWLVVMATIALGMTTFFLACVHVLARLRGHRAWWPAFLSPAAGLLVIASVAVTHWPLRAAYVLSRPALDALGARVSSGERVPEPIRAGLFIVRAAELSRGRIVCLWTDLNPSGRIGFVRHPPNHVPFNLWSQIALDDDWQFISED